MTVKNTPLLNRELPRRIVVGAFGLALALGLSYGLRLEAHASLFPNVYQFKVDGEVLYTFKDALEVQKALDSYMQSALLKVDPNAKVLGMHTLQTIEVVPVLAWNVKIDPIQDLYGYLATTQTQSQELTVQEGDNLWKIAEQNNLTTQAILDLNPQLDPDLIHPGDKITLSAIDPIIDVEIDLSNTVMESLPFKTQTIKDDSLYTSQKSIETKGIDGQKEVTYQITLLNGIVTSKTTESETVLSQATDQVVRIGTKINQTPLAGSGYGVTSGTLQSGFGYRTHPITGVKTFHNGIDISNKVDTPVFAYSSGTVTLAGWDGQLGNTIVIDHGDGLVTKYAHLNSILVAVGDTVDRSTQIAGMGKSGYATGVNLHFEVLKNGEYQNPLNYLY